MMTRICIYGAGAIGGYLGARLAASGEEVSLIARGAHLKAMQTNGLKLIEDGKELITFPNCTDDPTQLGQQDYVIITLKAPSVLQVVEKMQPLLGKDTAVVTAINGIPWWYFYGIEGPWKDHQLKSVDPDGKQWQMITPQRVIGCVVYPAAEVIAPGVIKHVAGNRFSLGEPDGSRSERVESLSQLLRDADLQAPVRSSIREEIWVKLWGNVTFNPISALTGATLDVILADPGTLQLTRKMMTEVQAVGEKLGVRFAIDIEQRINQAILVGAHKTSMLQDVERGKPLEIDALIKVVQELGQLVGVETPMIDSVVALIQQKAHLMGLY